MAARVHRKPPGSSGRFAVATRRGRIELKSGHPIL
jgi:hypothetical protein